MIRTLYLSAKRDQSRPTQTNREPPTPDRCSQWLQQRLQRSIHTPLVATHPDLSGGQQFDSAARQLGLKPPSAPRPDSARDLHSSKTPKAQPPKGLGRFDLRQDGGDGGNRTHVRDRVRMASTSVAGALISSLARLAGGVVRDQPP